jgi:hypothetical protein
VQLLSLMVDSAAMVTALALTAHGVATVAAAQQYFVEAHDYVMRAAVAVVVDQVTQPL